MEPGGEALPGPGPDIGHSWTPSSAPTPAEERSRQTSRVIPRQPVDLEDEVVLEEEEANDGEEVDENEG